jgi:hypothetical protein
MKNLWCIVILMVSCFCSYADTGTQLMGIWQRLGPDDGSSGHYMIFSATEMKLSNTVDAANSYTSPYSVISKEEKSVVIEVPNEMDSTLKERTEIFFSSDDQIWFSTSGVKQYFARVTPTKKAEQGAAANP